MYFAQAVSCNATCKEVQIVYVYLIINYRFLTTETNLTALYIFRCLFSTSSVKLFLVNVQIFVCNCVFQKKQHILEMKAHFEKKTF